MNVGVKEADLEAALVDLISRDAVEIEPYPAVALKISDLLSRPSYRVGELVRLVASDQALSARVIRAAGSKMFGMGTPIASVHEAIARLGPAGVSSLALASKLGVQAKLPGPLVPLKRRIWQDAVASAFLCQKLGASRHQPVELSFTCGLLHDFGRVVTATALEQILAQEALLETRPVEFWIGLIEKFHVQLGLLTATWWGMSTLLCEVISMHHRKRTDGCESPLLLDAVMAVDEVLALAARSPIVTPDDLLECPHLHDEGERRLMADALPQCPLVVETLEEDSTAAFAALAVPTAVAVSSSHDALRPLAIPAACGGHAGVAYRATGIGDNLLVLEGPAPLAINRLVQITLDLPQAPAVLWMNPQRCVAEGRVQRIELKPFALTGNAAQVWAGLHRGLAA